MPRFAQIDTTHLLEPQIAALIEQAGLTPQDWQTALLIINPPTLNYSVLAEVLNLQARREAAGRGQSDSVTDRSSRD